MATRRSWRRAALVLGLVGVGWACNGHPLSRDAAPPALDAATHAPDVAAAVTDGASDDAQVSQPPPVDSGPNCANVGCAPPRICSEGCTAPCGCCLCTPGQTLGELVCNQKGCYGPPPAQDAASDLVADVPDTGIVDRPADVYHADAIPRDAGTDVPLCGNLGHRCAANQLCLSTWNSPNISYSCVDIPSTCEGQELGCGCLEVTCGFDFFCAYAPEGASYSCIFKG